jgi:hypothetical protein
MSPGMAIRVAHADWPVTNGFHSHQSAFSGIRNATAGTRTAPAGARAEESQNDRQSVRPAQRTETGRFLAELALQEYHVILREM